jgi:hypothetical protein
LLLGVALLTCAIALARPALAHAGWPLARASSVTLGFGAGYRSAEATSSSTHRGIDIAAGAGESVLTPLAGTVTFAGSVPADGGGTTKAVTISTSAGSLTLMPLASLDVRRGAALAEGDSVGELAESGDGSSAGEHVHVGLKRGGLYLDPLSVLAPPAAASSGQAAGGGLTVSAPSAVTGVKRGRAAARLGRPRLSASARAVPLRAATPGTQIAPGVVVGGAAPAAAAMPTPVLPARPPALAQPPVPASHTAFVPPLTAAEALGRLLHLASAWVRALALGLLGMLAALACLWPLWRPARRKGFGEDRVRPIQDDVAAVVGR